METEIKATAGADHHEVNEVATAVQLAQDVEETKYSPWTLSMFRLYLVLACAYLCGCLNGYDGSLMGGLNGMSAYQKYFHMYVMPSPIESYSATDLIKGLSRARAPVL